MANKTPGQRRGPSRKVPAAVEDPRMGDGADGAQDGIAEEAGGPVGATVPNTERGRKPGSGRSPVIPAKGPRPDVSARRQRERAAAVEQRRAEKLRAEALQRRRQLRKVTILVMVGLLIVGAIVFKRLTAIPAQRALREVSVAAGCGSVQNTDNNLSHAHLTAGQAVTYSTSPPTGGAHNPRPLPAGAYPQLSADPNVYPNIYQAVHSMEHGYVIVWYKGLSSAQLDSLGQFGNDFKVIVTAYPQLPTGTVALTAWGRLQTCQRMSTAQIAQFIKLYRLKTASEPQAP